MRRYHLLCLLVGGSLLLLPTVKAQTTPPELQWNHTGRVTALGRQYFQSSATDYARQAELATVQTVNATYGTRWQARLSGRAILNDRHDHRRRAWINEAYVSYRRGCWFLKGGRQIVKWGKLSGWSALDLANRYDYYDFLATDEEQLGMWGLDARFTQGATALGIAVFPGQERSRVAWSSNRWITLPRRVPLPTQPELTIPFRQTDILRSRTHRIPQVGWNISTEIGRFTTRLGGYYGQNDIPQTGIQLNGITVHEATYTLQLQYHPILINTLNVATYLGRWNVWLEVADVHSRRRDLDTGLTADYYGFYSLGVDRLWLFDNPEIQLKLLLQYIHSTGNESTEYAATELDHVFRRSTIVDLDLRISYKWSVALRNVNDWATSGHYLQPRLRWKVDDRFQIELNADFLLGKPAGFFGLFQDNSRLILFCKYHLP